MSPKGNESISFLSTQRKSLRSQLSPVTRIFRKKQDDKMVLYENSVGQISKLSIGSKALSSELPGQLLSSTSGSYKLAPLNQGKFQIYKILGQSVTYLKCGQFVQPIFPKSRLWRLSLNKYIIPQPIPGNYWQFEIKGPINTKYDKLDDILKISSQYQDYYKEPSNPEHLETDLSDEDGSSSDENYNIEWEFIDSTNLHKTTQSVVTPPTPPLSDDDDAKPSIQDSAAFNSSLLTSYEVSTYQKQSLVEIAHSSTYHSNTSGYSDSDSETVTTIETLSSGTCSTLDSGLDSIKPTLISISPVNEPATASVPKYTERLLFFEPSAIREGADFILKQRQTLNSFRLSKIYDEGNIANAENSIADDQPSGFLHYPLVTNTEPSQVMIFRKSMLPLDYSITKTSVTESMELQNNEGSASFSLVAFDKILNEVFSEDSKSY